MKKEPGTLLHPFEQPQLAYEWLDLGLDKLDVELLPAMEGVSGEIFSKD